MDSYLFYKNIVKRLYLTSIIKEIKDKKGENVPGILGFTYHSMFLFIYTGKKKYILLIGFKIK